MTHRRWDEVLVAEHEMIERAMEVMKSELPKLAAGTKPSRQLSRAIDFLLQFGDKLHNHKEEDHLFPLMEQRGIPSQGGPIAVMLVEHEAERTLLSSMLAQLPDLRRSSEDQVAAFIREGTEYLQVRANHIWKENDVLYPMGNRVFSDEDNDALLAAFAALDADHYGPEAAAHYAKMLDEVEQGAEAQASLVHNLSYEQIHGIMETLPFEVTFVDADDAVAYFNRLDKDKVFVRTRSVIGRKVHMCHPSGSVDKVLKIVEGFKAGTLDKAEFWIDFKGDKILIRYFPVRDEVGTYLGVLEVTQEVGWLQKLEGEKRLLDE